MQDIADKLGLSKGTVSLVLSGKAKGSRVSEETIRKVKRMADELNYQPNEIARSLSTGKTMSIGVVITDISNEFFGHFTFHIQEQAKKYGYTVITMNTNESLEEFHDSVTILLNKQIDGIIFVPVAGGESVVEKIIERNLPIVQIDRFYPKLKASYIVVDNYHAAMQATELLIHKGHKKIAAINYDINLNALLERRQGYIDMMKRYGLFDPSLIKDINYEDQEEQIRQAIIDLKDNPDKVEAIFFCSRRVFITGIKHMRREGIRIPEDMEVLSFDKIETISIANIPINFIEQPIAEMGGKAVNMLMEQIQGDRQIKQSMLNTTIKHSI